MTTSSVAPFLLVGALIGIGINTGYSYLTGKPKIKTKIPEETSYDKNLKKSILDLGRNKQFMIYGFEHCNYRSTYMDLQRPGCRFEMLTDGSDTTLEGDLEKIPYTPCSTSNSDKIAARCKAQLVNLVFENYKREKLKIKPIPLLFFLDIENNKYPLTPKEWTSKDEKFSKIITFKELKRIYKLCNFTQYSGFSPEELEKDKELRDRCKEIERIAREMFIPVRLNADGSLTKLAPPWEDKEFAACWAERMKHSSPSSKTKISWRNELIKKTIEFDKSKKT